MKALLKNHRQSPRKVRLVTDAIKGKSVDDALVALSLMQKKATTGVAAVLRSAAANAKAKGVDAPGALIVSDVHVDKGVIMTRYRAQARGRAAPYRRISSHVSVVLSPAKGASLPKAKEEKAAPAKKPAAKKTATKTKK